MPSYLGQNFLTDSKAKTAIRDLILKYKETCNLTHCVEIGPGKGAITKLIQPIFQEQFWAIEKDTTFETILSQIIHHDHVIRNDVLQVDLQTLPVALESTLVYGSLPYYITSPIISQVFLSQDNKPKPIAGIFIVQKEFAEKVHAGAKKKSYLRRLLNHSHVVTYHKTIAAKGFSPAPKVDSAIISIVQTVTQQVDYKAMLILLDKISGFKRKTMGKILKMIDTPIDNIMTVPDSILKKRLEECSRDDMKFLVDHL
ncbi:MAG: rRNA adenine N-6-methyltransferase family protein [Candidatus Absconditabacterales bacterium]